jgi:hypothetical protein
VGRVFLLAAALCAGCVFRVEGLPIGPPGGDDLAASDLLGADLSAASDLAADDAADAGTALDATAGCQYALCEDFESGALAARWTQHATKGTVGVDQVRVHGGAYAFHAHTNASTPNNNLSANIAESETFPLLQAGVFLRAFLYLPSPAPASTGILFVVKQGGVGDELDVDSPGAPLLFYEFNSNPDVSVTSATAFPTDRWVCLEWQVLSGESRTFLDGVEVTDLHRTGLKVLAFDTLEVGLDFFSSANQPAYDLWIDDVAVNGSRIGCN